MAVIRTRFWEGSHVSQRHRVLSRLLADVVGLALVLALRSLLDLPATARPLKASEMAQFNLDGTRQTQWLLNGDTYPVLRQSWRHVETGSLLEVDFAQFRSTELAAAACQAQVLWTQLMPAAGTFSGETIGDQCWHWLTSDGGRLLFRNGTSAVDLAVRGLQSPDNVATLLEDVAARVLRHVR